MFTLTINLGNDVMQTADDVSNALRKVAARLRGRDWSDWAEKVQDENGNTVGEWTLSDAKTSDDEPEEA